VNRKAPWFKLWASDFLSDNFVDAMTAEQIGWYCILLIRSWNHTPKGYLPNDEHLLASWCKVADPMSFKQRAKLVLDRFETSEDGSVIYHPKLMEQVESVCKTSENRAVAGSLGGKKSAAKRRSKHEAIATRLPIDTDTESDTDKNLKTLEREAEEIYSIYPRKVGKSDALRAIRKAITRELKAHPQAAEYLKSRTLQFAKSDAGNRGEYTPHPSTWFNGSRYNDDEREWQRSDERRQPMPDVRARATVSCDECSDQFPVEHIGRHMTKNPVRQFCSEKCLNEYQGRLVSA
jgi:uncharacterized protein YdaU (DUF1376 family)